MPNVTQTVKFRQQRRAKDQNRAWLKISLVTALLVSLLGALAALAGMVYYGDITRNLPSVILIPTLLEPPNGGLLQPTRLYDRSHTQVLLTLRDPAAVDQQYLTIGNANLPGTSQAPQNLVDATIAARDPGFWHHAGYSLSGVAQGTHPTLAQVLVSSLLLDGEQPSLKRNIRERLLAAQLTSQYGREQVLEWYLNSARYGETVFGADAASRVYFGIPATRISISQAAMLTALNENPNLDPGTYSDLLQQDQEKIIQRMFVDGYITGDEAFRALKEDTQLLPQSQAASLSTQFTNLVLKQLSTVIPLERLYRGGFDITTSLDYGLQLQADCAVQVQIAFLQNTAVPTATRDSSPCEASNLLPSTQPQLKQPLKGISAEIIVLEPRTGQILALVVNGITGNSTSYTTTHTAGTILQPFLYLTAFTHGMSPASLIWDIPPSNQEAASQVTQAEQSSGSSIIYHGPISMRDALQNDYLSAGEQVLQLVGGQNVWLTEQQLGIHTSQPNSPLQTTLGDLLALKVSLLDTSAAYAVLANQGVMAGQRFTGDSTNFRQSGIEPATVIEVKSSAGQLVVDWSNPTMLPVVSSQLAYLTTSVLRDDPGGQAGSVNPARLEIGRPAAAKASMATDDGNTWVVGYIPQLVVGVWMGQEQGEPANIPAEMPAGLWQAITKYASGQLPVQDFAVPPGISLVKVCNPSGLLVTQVCPKITQEAFLAGNEPTRNDDLYQQVAIDRESGLLATVFTPAAQVENKVYLVVPPRALEWAKANGVDQPPESYDALPAATQVTSDVQFIQPQMSAQVGGVVTIEGSAGGAEFSYYRLEVGKGLNPSEWLQIGKDVYQSVSNAVLGQWDTKALQGVYIIKLVVVRNDLRVDQSMLQVTIDNTPPSVQIVSPSNGEKFTGQVGKAILINVTATDDQELQKIQFYIDGQLYATVMKPPYARLWDSQPGKHVLTLRAYDVAGNSSQTSASFLVNP